MSKSFKEALAERENARWETKIASVQEALGDDEVAISIFDRAVDMVKDAGVTDPYQVIDDAIDLTVAALTDEGSSEKVAEEAPAIDFGALGSAAAQVAHAAGITSEDVEKIASDDENEALGRLLAHCVWAELTPGE